jgi:Domain of unknown function (DUF4136)
MRIATLFTLSAAFVLAGCVVPTGPVEVTRFNRVAEGQAYGKGSFVVVLAKGAKPGTELTASPFLASVSREMEKLGYVNANGDAASDVVVSITIDTTERRKDNGSPVSVGVGGGLGGGGGGYGSGLGLGIGFNLGGAQKQVVTSLLVKIVRNNADLVIWEGRASQAAGAKTPAAQPGIAASKLASALFSGFPGNNGETIEVK